MGSQYMQTGESYLAKFPKLERWMNRCMGCGRRGSKPELPEEVGRYRGNLGAQTLPQFFSPLPLNDAGLCEECVRASGGEGGQTAWPRAESE